MLPVNPPQRVVVLLVLQEFIILSMLPVISPQRVVLILVLVQEFIIHHLILLVLWQ
jgi:hypothetical protein